jgi:hypothetical protein
MRQAKLALGCTLSLAVAGIAHADLVYDSTVGAGGSGSASVLFTTNNPNASMGDVFTVDATVPGGGIARAINFAFVVPANTAVPDVDAIVTFYGTHDGTAAGSAVALSDVLGSFRFNFGAYTPDPAHRGFLSGMQILPNAVDLSGGQRGISIRFVAAGTNDILPGSTISPAFSTGTVGVGIGTLTFFYLDGFGTNTLDGIYVGGERIGFGGANAENNKLWLQIDNVPAPGTAGLLLGFGVLALRRRR